MRAALYLRQSLDRDGQGLAVARQRQDCRRLADRKGWQVVEEFVDNDVSASSSKPRPAYTRMLDAIQAGQVEAVVVWAADRLHRRPVELEHFIDVADRYRTALATVSGDLDLGTPAGRLVARLLGAVARGEMETKSNRQQRANRQRAEAGTPRFTRRPFGYSEDGQSTRESEAAELRRAAQQVLAGSTLRDLVRDLNERRIVTSTGARWTVTSLRRLLMNPRIAGLNSYRGEIVGAGDWPAILDENTYQAVKAKLSDAGRRTATTNVRKYLLSGLVRCGRCGDAMYAAPMGPKGAYWMTYRCRTAHLARRLDLVDEVVEKVVIGRLSRPDAIDLLVDDEQDDAEELRTTATAIRAQIDEAAGLFADGTITGSQLRTISNRLRSRLAEVEQRQASSAGGHVLTDLVSAQDVAATWAALPLARKRAVIDVLMTVTILPAPTRGARFSPEQVRVSWRGE